MKEEILNSIANTLANTSGLEQEKIVSLLERPKNKSHGDLAFPCFLLAKEQKLSPADCAKNLASTLELDPNIASVSPLGPFLNFAFNRKKFSKIVINSVLAAESFSQGKKNDKKVVLEYSSPNIAKPFHVGHLRATLIGNSLDRVYRHLGWQLDSVNHLGDWGTQFGFVWAGCKLWGKPESPSVSGLVDLYRRATELKEAQEKDEKSEDPDVNEIARQYFIDLEEGKKEALDFWQWCLDISLEYLKKTYERLDIRFDHYTGESFYSPMLADVEKSLKDAGLLIESQGALGVDLSESSSGKDLGFARITTPDGRSLYLARDIAAATYRAATFAFDKALYVVGAPQTLHFEQLIEILRKLGDESTDSVSHVAFGHVLGMKTRGKGDFIELNDFLNEAEKRALDAYRNQVTKRPEGLDENIVARAVSHAAIIFSTLNKTRLKDVHFDWDQALAFQGDSGPYVLYAHARINSISEKAKENSISAAKEINGDLLTSDVAYNIVSHLSGYEDCLEKTIADNEPNHLAMYTLELAKLFSKAYLELKVIGEEKEVAETRLALFEATQRVISSGLKLLGITPIERM